MSARRSGSITLKLLATGSLVLLSLIPLSMVSGLVSERAGRRDQVMRETAASWGGRQVIGGVVLSVPYETVVRVGERTETCERVARFLPDVMRIDAELSPEVRRRSIFPVIVYRVKTRVTGDFAAPDLARLAASPERIHWERASLSVDVRDMRGVSAVAPLMWAGRPATLEPEGSNGPFGSGLRAITPIAPEDQAPAGVDKPTRRLPFSIDMALAGTERLAFLPFGSTTEVTLKSPWPHPGFSGALLPEMHRVDASGFSARWRVLSFARAYPQAWIVGTIENEQHRQRIAESEFGVTLVQTVDVYQQTERAVKYGLLFVVLTFTVFFLWELLRRLRLHPIQYVLVGMALVVFYLLLLSISEHAPFAVAYAVASGATVALVSGYAGRILQAGARGAVVAGVCLGALYGLLYVLLQLEDLALLVGAAAVFTALAMVMYLTRNVNWYDALSTTGPRPDEGGATFE